MRFSMKAISASLLTVGLLGATQASANELYFQLNPNYIGAGARQAFIFGAANATGSVTGTNGFNQIFDLGVSGFSVIDVPTSAELSNNTVENLGFKISSSTNISGYYLSRQDFTTDMSYLIDGDKLGTKYVVSTYAGSFDEQISVQATQDNTKVTFSLKTGETVVQTLNAGQTYMIARSQELTGSMVESDKPVAVLSGNACTNVPAGVPACDHIVEQMPSVASLSKEYYVAPTPRTGANGDVVRIVASENGTAVTVNGVPQGTLNAGEFKEIRITAGSNVVADKPVLVAQYLVGQNEAGTNTDPAMTIVPGKDQWLKNYVFATPSGTAAFPTDYMSIIIPGTALGSLKFNGVPVSPTCVMFGVLCYADIDVSTQTGPLTVSADEVFQLLLSGYDNYDSYFTYGGAAFAPGASPNPNPGTVPEPASALLVTLGLASVAAVRSRRKA
jgi:hypothetical protein